MQFLLPGFSRSPKTCALFCVCEHGCSHLLLVLEFSLLIVLESQYLSYLFTSVFISEFLLLYPTILLASCQNNVLILILFNLKIDF